MDRGRDRDRDRDRDRRGDGEVTRMGAGESYRPSARTDTFRSGDRDRSPPRRARSPPITDSWHPGSRDRSPPRRRSRTPPRRERSPLRDNWRARPRTPLRARSPPRRFSPRRDDDRRARSPPRIDRRRSRSPYDRDRAPRARSPLPRRSPPAAPRSYRGRSRSPPRRDDRAPSGPSSSNWRRRSPSPSARESERSSGRTSADTSRRSSPHIHPDRMHITSASNRDVRARSPPRERERSPAQLAYRDRESAKSTPRERSPPRAAVARSPPRGPAGFRAPTGPAGARTFTAPSAPSSTLSMSAHNRPENAGPVVPPAGPRGYFPPVRGAPYGMRGGRGSFGSDRQIRPETGSWGAAPPSRPAVDVSTRSTTPSSRPTATPSPSIPSGPSIPSIPTGPSAGIPTGPRAGVPSRPQLQHSSNIYGTRTNSIQSNVSAGPRPHPAMANMAQIIPGGRIDPTMTGITAEVASRLKRKEEEAEILREDLNSKQEKLRQSLKVWDKLKANSTEAGLRSELSERHVRMLAGEGVGGAAF